MEERKGQGTTVEGEIVDVLLEGGGENGRLWRGGVYNRFYTYYTTCMGDFIVPFTIT